MVYDSLKGLGFSSDVSRLITRLTTLSGNIPQGCSTSPFLANLIGLSMDKKILDYIKGQNLDITYSRYVDDIALSSNADFKEHIPTILSFVISEGFFYNHKKTVYKAGKIELTGVGITCNGLLNTEKQTNSLNSDNYSEIQKAGMIIYRKYVEGTHKSFNIKRYKNEFPGLKYPNKLSTRMNRPKAKKPTQKPS